MKFSPNAAAFKKPLKQIEIISLVIFTIFLLFPFRIPTSLAKLINNPLGILIIFVIIIFLFVKAHIIVAILYLLVAYELIRRSGKTTSASIHSDSRSSTKFTKTPLNMTPINGTSEINHVDKNYSDNYKVSNNQLSSTSAKLSDSLLKSGTPVNSVNEISKSSVPLFQQPVYTMNPQKIYNYASIGSNSKESDREKELARINPEFHVGSTLEEEIIKERVPADALHTNNVYENTSYSPVYDTTIYEVSTV